MPEEMDAEDGEVREVPIAGEDRKDERRKGHSEDNLDRGLKRHRSDKDRSRSRERTRYDRDREREKRISYDQVVYSGDAVDRYDRYAMATVADGRDFKMRNERGRDFREPERDERSSRASYEKDREVDMRDREKRREKEPTDKDRDRERRREESDRKKDRDDDGDRRKEKDRTKERSKERKDSTKRSDEHRKDEKSDRRRSKSRDRKGKDSDRHEGSDRKKERSHRDKEDKTKSSGKDEGKTARVHEDDGLLTLEDEEAALRKKRAEIMEKIKSKAGLNGSALSGPPSASVSQAQTPAQEDVFDDKKSEDEQEPEQKAPFSASAEPEEVEDKDEIGTAEIFAAKEKHESDEGEDDMFTTSPMKGRAGPPRMKVGDEEVDRSGVEEERRLGDTNADNWDDAEGYFRTRPGELLISRYLVNRDIGNGVYSTVLSATDQQTSREVAIKVVRSNETMTIAGRKEIEILKKLGAEDPDGRRHICKLLSHFEYKNHLCMVFVPLEMNLRKLLKTYGREVGITLSAIRQYTRQLLIGLAHMIKCKVVHGDIKLDNIVITKDLKNVAICDFGTADWESECVITPYMVSRFYRPPEICLGHRYGHPMDLWSVGVCLFELYTGKFMFTGRTNNDMLKQFMDYKGAPNKRFLKKGQFFDQHFEEEKGQVVFKWLTQDKVTKAEIIEKKIYDRPVKSIYEQLRKVRSSSDDAKKIKEFADLLEQIFIVDPIRRISVSEALKHPFLH